MQVVKFDEDNWREWLQERCSDRLADMIIEKLQRDRFEVVQGWTEERIAVELFEWFEEDYKEYGFGVTTHLPDQFLPLCLKYIDRLEALHDSKSLFLEVAEEDFNEDIFLYAYECADNNEESRPTPDDIADRIDHYAWQWLDHVVREAIAAYTEPDFGTFPSLSNYTE